MVGGGRVGEEAGRGGSCMGHIWEGRVSTYPFPFHPSSLPLPPTILPIPPSPLHPSPPSHPPSPPHPHHIPSHPLPTTRPRPFSRCSAASGHYQAVTTKLRQALPSCGHTLFETTTAVSPSLTVATAASPSLTGATAQSPSLTAATAVFAHHLIRLDDRMPLHLLLPTLPRLRSLPFPLSFPFLAACLSWELLLGMAVPYQTAT